jgi:hypothetical protein
VQPTLVTVVYLADFNKAGDADMTLPIKPMHEIIDVALQPIARMRGVDMIGTKLTCVSKVVRDDSPGP